MTGQERGPNNSRWGAEGSAELEANRDFYFTVLVHQLAVRAGLLEGADRSDPEYREDRRLLGLDPDSGPPLNPAELWNLLVNELDVDPLTYEPLTRPD
jgi:hypothetical protein